MCGRYTLYITSGLKQRYITVNTPSELRENYNVAPGQMMPVIIDEDGKRKVVVMKWGLVPFWAKDTKIGYKLINARSESIFEKPMWKGAVMHKRCLVPSNGFYEWKRVGDKEKQPYYIHPKGEKLFSFAGIYSTWKDHDGVELQSFSIITCEPNEEMKDVHDRMPVILKRDDEESWLRPLVEDRQNIEMLLQPYPDGELEMFKVSSVVNSPKNNDKRLIYHLDDNG